jgi:hypothetical protein
MPALRTRTRRGALLLRGFASSLVAAPRHSSAFADVERYCMFIGSQRSGHSVVGSLIDAHPDAVIAHELDALGYVKAGFSRNQLFTLIVRKANRDALGGRTQGDYAYAVPNQWQGRFRRLRVIGDKQGGRSVRRMMKDPHLIEKAGRLVGRPIAFVHVTRNPFDNIGTLHQRNTRGTALDQMIEGYFALCRGVAETRSRFGDDVIHVRHEDLLADPGTALRRLCRFLDLDADDDYVDDCAGILFTSPRRTRHATAWTDAQLRRVQAGIAEYPFLDGYDFDS